MSYERLPNETDEELFLRICRDKDNIGSWNKVAEILNETLNQHFDESTYRRRFKVFANPALSSSSQLKSESISTADDFSQLNKLRKERLKIQTLNLERNRIDRAEARQELFYEQVGQYVQAMPVPDFKEPKHCVEQDHAIEYLVTIADVHYNACFDSQNNRYSPLIAQQRMDILASEIINFICKNGVSKIHVLSLGDSIQGLIHLSDVKINDSSFVRSVVEYSRLMATMLNQLSEYADVEYYHTPTANHTQIRALNCKANELPVEDVEYIIGHYIKDLCRDNNRINVNLAERDGQQFIEMEINGFKIVGMHGHTIKNINTAIDDISGLIGDPVDFLFLGHYHRSAQVTSREVPGLTFDTEVILCPSFVGADPYADRCLKSSKPASKIFGIDENYGITETYKIILC